MIRDKYSDKVSENEWDEKVSYLIMNSRFCGDIGLYYGKIGIVIFFMKYARYTQMPVYEQFAYDLLQDIYEELHMDLSINFERGLCGIGWGIEYLANEGCFPEYDPGILSEFDEKIMSWDPGRIKDLSEPTGLCGILNYVVSRLYTARNKYIESPFDDSYLIELQMVLNERREINKSYIVESFFNLIKGESFRYNYKRIMARIIDQEDLLSSASDDPGCGLKKGYSGLLLKYIL